MAPLFVFLGQLLQIYIMIVFGMVIFSWLIAFDILPRHHRATIALGEFFTKATEPLLRQIRRIMPDLGPIDISPAVLILGLILLQQMLRQAAAAGAY